MKKIAVTLTLGVALSVAFAEAVETKKDVVCDNKKELFDWVQTNEYQEKLIWMGDSPLSKTKLAVISNKDTGTWTIIEFNDKYACVLSVGISSKLVPTKPVGTPI